MLILIGFDDYVLINNDDFLDYCASLATLK